MPFPVFRHHDATQVGMAAKMNAEQVENLALIEVRSRPRRGNAVDRRGVTVEPNDQADSSFKGKKEKVIDDLETRLGRIPIDRSDIFNKGIAVSFQSFANRNDRFAGYLNC